MNMPLVSILMPAYNSERFIGEAIDSILNQSYTNFELIIFDDGSSDGTRKVIESYNDSRIVKVLSDENFGVVKARNEMIDRARGKYIALMDADDISDPVRLKKQVLSLEAGNCDVSGSAQLLLNQETGSIKKSKDNFFDSDIRALLSVYCTLCNSSVTARAEIFKKFKYDENFPVAEDYLLWTRIAAAGYRFQNLPDRLVTYRVYPEQSSSQHREKFSVASLEVKVGYLKMLGISGKYTPKSLPFHLRLMLGSGLIKALNLHVGKTSYRANCEIYNRFQYRRKGLPSLLQRIERITLSAYCYVLSRLVKF